MKKGFTLIEVLVVAVIVAILAAVAIPAYNSYIQSSKENVARNTAGTVAAILAAYYSEWPATKSRIESLTGTPGEKVIIGAIQYVQLPADFGLTVAVNIVTIYHKDGTASGSVPWY